MKNPQLEQLLQSPHLWQASRPGRVSAVFSTGYDDLDKQLHLSGWPQGSTTELLLTQSSRQAQAGAGMGIGEMRLLIPGLRQIQAQRPWLVLIDPPFVPYAPALAQAGINPAGVLVIKPRSAKDLLWCAENSLRSGCCGAVLTFGASLNLDSKQLRRLQRAAYQGSCWHVLFRASTFSRQPSASALRIQLGCDANGLLQLQILKQRGGWSGQQLSLRLQPDLTQLQWLHPKDYDRQEDQPGIEPLTSVNNVISFPAAGL